MAIRESACEVFEVVIRSRWLSHLGDDPEGERVASDASEVLAEQVGGSLCLPVPRSGPRAGGDRAVVV